MFDFQEELHKLPHEPGVYIMHDKSDAIIYVGKAKDLHNRVRSYFRANIGRGPWIDRMVSLIAYFEYIVTDSELESLVLENNLIKEHRPKYNTLLVDDKTYPYIKVSVDEQYPRITMTRKVKKDKARYFGPYTSALAVKDTIELVNKLCRLRTCNKHIKEGEAIDRPCLNYHMDQCMAPCRGLINADDYARSVERALDILSGNVRSILYELESKMSKQAADMQFEEAAATRDLIASIKHVSQKQKITDSDLDDKDVIALAKSETDAVVQVFFIRAGKLIGREHFYMKGVEEKESTDILGDFVKQFYAGTPYIPREIMLQYEIEDTELLENWLSDRRGSRTYIRIPKIGSKEKLVELAAKNASLVLEQDRERIKREEGRTIGAVKEIEQLIGVKGIKRMEAFDISNIFRAAHVLLQRENVRSGFYRQMPCMLKSAKRLGI